MIYRLGILHAARKVKATLIHEIQHKLLADTPNEDA